MTHQHAYIGGKPYQPKTGQACHCKRGQQRDNCPDCEGTGQRIDFAKIRNERSTILEHATEQKHAPWYEAKTGNHQGLIIEEGTGRNIAVAYDKSDAPLIAAAPAMLEALEQFVRYADGGKHQHLARYMQTVAGAKTRAAILKAKGGK
jgi:hypothetical protein